MRADTNAMWVRTAIAMMRAKVMWPVLSAADGLPAACSGDRVSGTGQRGGQPVEQQSIEPHRDERQRVDDR